MVIATLTNYDDRYDDDTMIDSEKERLAIQHQLAANGNPNIITSSLMTMISYYRNKQPGEALEELNNPTNDFLERAARLARSSNIYRFNRTTGKIDEITPGKRLITFVDDFNMPYSYRTGGKSFRRKSTRRRRHNKKSTRRRRRKY
jgi:hypothetical protein